jgi:hypothetical protein
VRHRVGREKRLELVELGFAERFVEGAGIGHCGLSAATRRRNLL